MQIFPQTFPQRLTGDCESVQRFESVSLRTGLEPFMLRHYCKFCFLLNLYSKILRKCFMNMYYSLTYLLLFPQVNQLTCKLSNT